MWFSKLKYNNLAILVTSIMLLLFLSVTSVIAQNKVDLDKGLVGYYPFGDGADDESGNGNHGEIDGVNLERDVSGTYQASYRVNSEDDFIRFPIDINIGTMPQVSLCAWVLPIRHTSKITVLSNDDRGGDRKLYSIRNTSDKKPTWAISDGKGGFIGKVPVERGEWVFLVATYDNDKNTGSIYVNGVKTSGKTQMDMGKDYLYMGSNPYESTNEDYEAWIDEVRVYDRVLDKAEIDSLKNLVAPHQFRKNKSAISYVFIPTQDNLIVRTMKTTDSKSIGKVSKIDTLLGKEVKAKGVGWAEWLEVSYEGKTGYVQLKYLDKINPNEASKSDFELFMDKYADWGSWQFWVVTLGVLLFSFGASMQFAWVDGVLSSFSNSEYEGNLAFFPVFTGLSGVVFAILMVIWQDQIEYYLGSNFTFWPSGYGFSAWAVLLLIVANSVIFVMMIIESLGVGNIIHGVLRILIQAVLGVLTFISAVVITFAVILIVIGLVVVFFAVTALFYRRIYTDMWGNTYVEDY